MRTSRPTLGALVCWVMVGLSAFSAVAFDHSYTNYARVLERFVAGAEVDYAALKADASDLRAFLEAAAAVSEKEFNAWTKPRQLAFLLNLYNAAVLQFIVDHYPVSSIRKIGGLFQSPWNIEVVRLWGQMCSLGWLEHGIIRARYQDPRAHFALVCAAKGCPPLRSEPYVAERLDALLEHQGRTFLRQADKNRVDAQRHILYLSPIFKWYRDDFTAKAGSLEAAVRPYLSENDARAVDGAKFRIVFTPYDWSLNDRSKDTPGSAPAVR